MIALLSLFFFGVAILLTVIGTGMSVIYNLSAVSYSEFDMSSQPYQWFGFWVMIYAGIPALMSAFISHILQPIKSGRWFIGGPFVFATLLNAVVYLKSI